MDIININKVPKKPYVKSLFTGSEVTLQELLPNSSEFKVNIVNFGKGVRNKLHFHSTEQILFVIEGTGIVATDKQEFIVKVGDIIRIPANEKHWHGASNGSTFSHIFITLINSDLSQIEK